MKVMAVEEGDIVLVAIPQAGGELKNRPVLLHREVLPFNDFLACGIRTQLRQEVKGFDHPINIHDPKFAQAGLVQDSLIRSGFLAIIQSNKILGSIGKLDERIRKELLQRVARHLIQ